MAADDQTPRTQRNTEKSKKQKKPNKDKWGRPLSAAVGEPEQEPPEEPVVAAVAEEEEEGEEAESDCGNVVSSGLPYTITEAEIRELFVPLRSLQLSHFSDSGNFRGLAFVSFDVTIKLSDEVAMKSLELDGFKIGNYEGWKMQGNCNLEEEKEDGSKLIPRRLMAASRPMLAISRGMLQKEIERFIQIIEDCISKICHR